MPMNACFPIWMQNGSRLSCKHCGSLNHASNLKIHLLRLKLHLLRLKFHLQMLGLVKPIPILYHLPLTWKQLMIRTSHLQPPHRTLLTRNSSLCQVAIDSNRTLCTLTTNYLVSKPCVCSTSMLEAYYLSLMSSLLL